MENKKLIEDYINGWLKNNEIQILEILDDSRIIIESHGTKYVGKEKCKKWIKEWLTNNKVIKWEIISFYELKQTAFFEWKFECTGEGKKHFLEGISIVRFEDNKIKYLREYRTTKPISIYD